MPGLRAPVHRRGRSVWVQRGGNAGYGGVSSGPRAWALASRAASPPRSGPPGPQASERAPPAPSRGKLQLIRFFSRHFSPTSFFVLSRFGGQSEVQESKHKTKPEVGRWGAEGGSGARSSAPVRVPAPTPAPFRPPARVARPGGQLLYWHALRPEAGPCRPP